MTVNHESLRDRRVLVTRPEDQAGDLVRLLERRGATALVCPLVRIRPPSDPGSLRRALGRTDEYDWIVFTSVNGVRRVREELGGELRRLDGLRAAAIGPATADAVEERLGLRATVVPDEYRAERLVEALRAEAGREGDEGSERGRSRSLVGLRFLLPRADLARETLAAGLREAGGEVDEVTAYESRPPLPGEVEGAVDEVRRGEVDWLTFTASSTVRHWCDLAGGETGEARVATIGPITAGAAREAGLPVHVVAEEYTIAGLVRALERAESGGRRET